MTHSKIVEQIQPTRQPSSEIDVNRLESKISLSLVEPLNPCRNGQFRCYWVRIGLKEVLIVRLLLELGDKEEWRESYNDQADNRENQLLKFVQDWLRIDDDWLKADEAPHSPSYLKDRDSFGEKRNCSYYAWYRFTY